MLASGPEHWRHHPRGQPWGSAELLLIHSFSGKGCTGKYVPEGQHGRTQGTQPRPSPPRMRYHSVAVLHTYSRHKPPWTLCLPGTIPSDGPQRHSFMCASTSLFLSFCSTQQNIGTLTGYLSTEKMKGKRKKKKSSLNSIMNSSTCLPKGMNYFAWWLKDKFWRDQERLKNIGRVMAFVCLLLQRSLWEKKSILFLSPKALSFIMSIWQVCKFQQWKS